MYFRCNTDVFFLSTFKFTLRSINLTIKRLISNQGKA